MTSLNVFLAVCVVSVDFLLCVLFQWTYADRRRAMAKKLAAQRAAMEEEKVRPFVVRSRKDGPLAHARLQRVRTRMAGVA